MNFRRKTLAGIGLSLAASVSQAKLISIDPTIDGASQGGTVNFSFNV